MVQNDRLPFHNFCRFGSVSLQTILNQPGKMWSKQWLCVCHAAFESQNQFLNSIHLAAKKQFNQHWRTSGLEVWMYEYFYIAALVAVLVIFGVVIVLTFSATMLIFCTIVPMTFLSVFAICVLLRRFQTRSLWAVEAQLGSNTRGKYWRSSSHCTL